MVTLIIKKLKGIVFMKTNEYVKFLTMTLLDFFEQPKEERKKRKFEKKQLREPFVYRWFGIFPYLFRHTLKMAKQKKKKNS